MKRFIVQRDYESHYAKYKAGAIIEIQDDDEAAWLLRDAPGTFIDAGPGPKEPEPEPEVRAVEQPPQDRMVRKTSKRRRPRANAK